MKKAVIYARYSAGPRQTDQSIEGQISDCKRYAEAHDLNVIDIYADRHISGKSTEGRDEFLRMIDDAKKGLFDAVVVWKIDRFGRDKTDIAIYKRELKKAGVKLHYAAENVPEGPEGIILESLLEGLAEYYSADLQQKVNRGMRETIRKGKFPCRVPYGYIKDQDLNVHPDREKAEYVREIFRLHNEGHSIPEIVRIFENKAVYFSNGTIYYILHNGRYLGTLDAMGMSIQVEPIITQEVWEMAQEKFRKKPSKSARIKYVLSGKCICAECQGNVKGVHGTSKNGKKFAYYQCSKKCFKPIPKDKFEVDVIENVREVALTDAHIGQIADKVMELQNADLPQGEIKRISAQIKDFQKRIDNLYSAIEQGLDMTDTIGRINAYKDNVTTLSIELEKLQTKKPVIPREYIVKWLESFRDGDIMNDKFCERVVDTFISKILIYPDHAIIVLNITGNKEEPQCSTVLNLVDLTQNWSNKGEPLVVLPYALLWVKRNGH